MHLRGLVDGRAAIGERLDVGGDEMRRGGQRGARVIAAADLPVKNLDPRCAIGVVKHEDALGRKPSVDDPLFVGMADGLGDLADDREPSVNRQLAAPLREIVVEPDLAGVVIEEHRGPEFVGCEVLGAEDARMIERFEELKLTQGGSLERVALVRRGGRVDRIETDPPERRGQRLVGGPVVLKPGALIDGDPEDVIAHLPCGRSRSDASLLERLRDRLARGAIAGVVAGGKAPPLAVGEQLGDAWPLRGSGSRIGGAVAEQKARAGRLGQVDLEPWGGAKHSRFDAGDFGRGSGGPLAFE